MRRRSVGGFGAAVALLGLVGCGPAGPPAAAQEYCQNLTVLHTALGNLTTGTPSTTLAQAQGSVAQVRSAWDKVTTSAGHARQARRSDLEQAHSAFQREASTLPSAATPAQNAQTVAQAMTTLRTAVAFIRADYARTTSECE